MGYPGVWPPKYAPYCSASTHVIDGPRPPKSPVIPLAASNRGCQAPLGRFLVSTRRPVCGLALAQFTDGKRWLGKPRSVFIEDHNTSRVMSMQAEPSTSYPPIYLLLCVFLLLLEHSRPSEALHSNPSSPRQRRVEVSASCKLWS